MRYQIVRILAALVVAVASSNAFASVVVNRLVEYPTGIDPTRTALLPGETSNDLNYINSIGGITSILIDLDGMPASGNITQDDFNFRIGNSVDISAWSTLGQAPVLNIVSGGGTGGSDRLHLSWPSGAIENTWLEVRVEATADTDLTVPDVFYFGHLVGDTNRDGRLTPIDSLLIFNALNRDGMLSPADALVVINAINAGLPPLVTLSPPVPDVPIPASVWLFVSGLSGLVALSRPLKSPRRPWLNGH